jgi:hypothetical protein
MSSAAFISSSLKYTKASITALSVALFVSGSAFAQSMVPMPTTPVGVDGDPQASITYDTPRAPALGMDPKQYPSPKVVPAGQQYSTQQQYVQPTMMAPTQAPAMAPMPITAPMPMAAPMAPAPVMNIPSFTPTNGWQITKTSLSQGRGLQGIQLPCLMTAEYDNGFIVRLSGGGGSILAMAIDFRQSIFKQGKQYSAAVTSAGVTKSIEATAFAPNILLFGTRDWPSFYATLSQGTDMVIDVEGNVMRFMMADMTGGFSQLEKCFNPTESNAPAIPIGAPMTPSTPTTQASNSQESWESPRKPSLSEQPRVSKNEFQSSDTSYSGPASKAQLWKASAGETLDTVLARWGQVAGVDVSWQAGAPIPVQSDFQFRGGFTQAVQTLMAQNAAISGLKANLVGDVAPVPMNMGMGAGVPTPLTPMAGGISSHQGSLSAPPTRPDTAGKWSAPAGASLQGVLALWAEREGLDFVWQSSQNFALKRGINAGGSFESAVQTALEQFSNDVGIYPTAKLNTDPKTGQRVLFVFSSRR